MSTAVETNLDLTFLEDLDFEIRCAHSHHEENKISHDSGAAKFIFHFEAPCGSANSQPVCGLYGKLASRAASWRCLSCTQIHMADEVKTWLEPIDVDSADW